jgi:hypothetical protein
MSSLPNKPNASAEVWLFGSVPDLLLGCGGLYFVGWLALTSFGSGLITTPPALLAPTLILIFSVPHYGATLLRVYERREDRRAYSVFSVWITLGLIAAFGWALQDVLVASWALTIYLTWSPWHYSGQNFGISVLLLRRRGIPVDGTTRRLLYSSFTLSFLLTVFAMHASRGRITDYQVELTFMQQVRFLPIGFPESISQPIAIALAAAWVIVTIAALTRLFRHAPLRKLSPILSLVLLQSLWFTLPFGLGYFGIRTGLPVIDLGTRTQFFTYIAIGHAIQYLWITTYFARAAGNWSGYATYWAKALAFGQAVAVLPIVLVGWTGFGRFSYDSGVLLIVIAFMNLHHFILDGAIWKLRDGRIARLLIRADHEDDRRVEATWRRRLGWATAVLAVVIGALTHLDRHLELEQAWRDADADRARITIDRMALFGHESAADRLRLATVFADLGNDKAAEDEILRSLELREFPEGYGVLGTIYSRRNEWQPARLAFEQGLGLRPGDPRLLRGAGLAALRLEDFATADEYLSEAVERGRRDQETINLLREARSHLSKSSK